MEGKVMLRKPHSPCALEIIKNKTKNTENEPANKNFSPLVFRTWQEITSYHLRISPIFVRVVASLWKQQLNGHKQIPVFQKNNEKVLKKIISIWADNSQGESSVWKNNLAGCFSASATKGLPWSNTAAPLCQQLSGQGKMLTGLS